MIYIYYKKYLISRIPDFVIIFWVLKKRIWKEGFKFHDSSFLNSIMFFQKSELFEKEFVWI